MLEFSECRRCRRAIPIGVMRCSHSGAGRSSDRGGFADNFVFRRTNRIGTLVSLVIALIVCTIVSIVTFIGMAASFFGSNGVEIASWTGLFLVSCAITAMVHLNLRQSSDANKP